MCNNFLGGALVLGLSILVGLALLSGGGCSDDKARDQAAAAMAAASEAKTMAKEAMIIAKQAQSTADQAVQVGNNSISKGTAGTLLGASALAVNVMIVVYLYRKAKGKAL